MSTFQRFTEIEAWQKARELTFRVYAASKHGAFAKDFELRGQIRGASVSVMSNIAERFDRNGTAEFVQFLAIAKRSIAEVASQLYVAKDQRYVSAAEFDQLLMSSLFRDYVASVRPRGEPFRSRSMVLCLAGHHPVLSIGGNARLQGLKTTFALLCPRSPGLTPRSLFGYSIVDSLIIALANETGRKMPR